MKMNDLHRAMILLLLISIILISTDTITPSIPLAMIVAGTGSIYFVFRHADYLDQQELEEEFNNHPTLAAEFAESKKKRTRQLICLTIAIGVLVVALCIFHYIR